jgi:hypothetical protein
MLFAGLSCRLLLPACFAGFFQPCDQGFFTREKPPRQFIVGDFWGFLQKTGIFPTKKVLSRPWTRKKRGKIPVARSRGNTGKRSRQKAAFMCV